jgi:histidinol-phosphatase (PHP family)
MWQKSLSMHDRGPLLDCHIHSRFSCDSDATIEAICRAAVERGLGLICLTDHVDFHPLDPGCGYFDYHGYKAAIRGAQERWEGQIDVLAGIEVDYQQRFEGEIELFLADKEFDFVLGAVHACSEGWLLPDFFANRTEEASYGMYFSEMAHLLQCDFFDSVSHLDIVKRFGAQAYGPFDFTRWATTLEELLAAIIENGLGLEINTSGLRQAPGETFPGLPTLELYHDLGGEMLTIGSDAHRPEDVGEGVAAGLALAREAGFDHVTVLRDRRPESVSLSNDLCSNSRAVA